MKVLRPLGIEGHIQGENRHIYVLQSGDDDYLMNETTGGNLPPGHDALLFSINDTRSFICPVA